MKQLRPVPLAILAALSLYPRPVSEIATEVGEMIGEPVSAPTLYGVTGSLLRLG
ncbi:MAG: hypothetical protein WD231_03325 [Candidatus Woykebacteria bacterium]